MDSYLDTLRIAAGGMKAQATRVRLSTENLAGSDVPGYRGKKVVFSLDTTDGQDGGVKVDRVFRDGAPLRLVHEPGHPLADANGYVALSNVDPLLEIADAREAQRSFEANLSAFDQARRMYGRMLDLIRR